GEGEIEVTHAARSLPTRRGESRLRRGGYSFIIVASLPSRFLVGGWMSQAPSRSLGLSSLDAESAAALDGAIDALQTGPPLDRAALVARFPHLADALAALDDLVVTRGTTPLPNGGPATGPAPVPGCIGPYQIERELG